jgi:hypothetical protein
MVHGKFVKGVYLLVDPLKNEENLVLEKKTFG